MTKKVEAIQRLRPNAEFVLRGDVLEWLDETQTEPTAQEIADEIAYLESPEYEVEKWRSTATLSRRRFKIGEALYQVNGTPLVELIEALLAGLPEPQKTVATISYEHTGNFDRLDPFILQFSQALGMSEEQVDDFFQFCLEEAWNVGS